MYEFGKRSTDNLNTVHIDLQQLAIKVLKYEVMDFSIIEGHRTIEEQQMLFNGIPKKTHIDGINRLSKHNYEPSRAIDVLPYPSEVNGVGVWSDKQRFSVLAGLFLAAARELDIKIRWGGDWDGDGNNADSSLHDMPHIELDGDY